MVESIVAAACSRIGKNVLHLDSSDHYGGLWASYNFDGLQKFIKDVIADPSKQEQVYNLAEKWYIEKYVWYYPFTNMLFCCVFAYKYNYSDNKHLCLTFYCMHQNV